MGNLTRPMGGAMFICLLGLVFGVVAQRGGSVLASTIAHALNNLFAGL